MQSPPLLFRFDWDTVDLDSVLANSYKDFHCKGLDYICLQRKSFLTIKAYFFEDAIVDLPEVVCPHDHRYSFTTEVVTGEVKNARYTTEFNGIVPKVFQQYDWDTPLNGGIGFSGGASTVLCQKPREGGIYRPGERYQMKYNQLHTIKILAPETCILVFQYQHKLSIGQTTRTFCLGDPPETNDLYNEFSADQALKRINWLREKYNG